MKVSGQVQCVDRMENHRACAHWHFPSGTKSGRGPHWRGDGLEPACSDELVATGPALEFTKCLPHIKLGLSQSSGRLIYSIKSLIVLLAPKARESASSPEPFQSFICPGSCSHLAFRDGCLSYLFTAACLRVPAGRGGRAKFVSASHSHMHRAKVCTSEVLGNVSVFGACLLKLDGVQFRTFCPASCVGRSHNGVWAPNSLLS